MKEKNICSIYVLIYPTEHPSVAIIFSLIRFKTQNIRISFTEFLFLMGQYKIFVNVSSILSIEKYFLNNVIESVPPFPYGLFTDTMSKSIN